MIVECPKCSVKFNIGKAVLAKGAKKLKCSKCEHIWLEGKEKEVKKPQVVKPVPQKPKEKPVSKPKPKPVKKPEPIPEAVKPLSKDDDLQLADIETDDDKGKKNQEKKAALGVGVLVFLLLSFSTIGVAILMKDKIIHQWSSSVLLYETLGLYSIEESSSIRFRNVTSEWKTNDTGQFLYIEFDVNNISDHSVVYPNVEILTKGDAGNIIKSWHPKPKKEKLEAGETDKVRLGFRDVDPNGKSVIIKIVQ